VLLFKKKFLPAIRSGEKTQTVRLWKFRKMKPGQRSYIPTVGYIRVHAVDEVQLKELTDEDARLDGFTSVRALRKEINSLYAHQLDEGHRAYRIRFTVLADDEQKKARRDRAKHKRAQARS